MPGAVARFRLCGTSVLLADGLLRQSGSTVYLTAASLQDCIRRGACRYFHTKNHDDKRVARAKAESIRVTTDVEVSARFEPISLEPLSNQTRTTPEKQDYSALSETWQGEITLQWDIEGVDEHKMLILLNYAGTTVGLGAHRAEVGEKYGRFIALPA